MKKRAVKKTAGRWSKVEHKLFEEGISLYGDNWEAIADHVGTRTSQQIRNHCLKAHGSLNVSELVRASKHSRKVELASSTLELISTEEAKPASIEDLLKSYIGMCEHFSLLSEMSAAQNAPAANQ